MFATSDLLLQHVDSLGGDLLQVVVQHRPLRAEAGPGELGQLNPGVLDPCLDPPEPGVRLVRTPHVSRVLELLSGGLEGLFAGETLLLEAGRPFLDVCLPDVGPAPELLRCPRVDVGHLNVSGCEGSVR